MTTTLRPAAADPRVGAEAPSGAGRAVPALVLGAGVLLVVMAALVDARTTGAERDAVGYGRGAVTALVGLVPAASAAVVLRSRPGHLVGVVLAGTGLLWALDGLAESWTAYSFAHGLTGTDLAATVVDRVGAFLLLGLPLLLVLYPTGGLPEGRWRRVAIGTVVAAASLPVALVLAPDSVVLPADAPPGIRTDLLALPVPDGVAVAVLTVARVLTLLSLLAALLVVAARHRRASGLERTRLRWLLWAGVVCLLTVVVMLLVPAGPVTTAALVIALAVTSASVAVGVVRPDLADVDALVAGTLTYAGVAAVVVAIDLAALAAAGAWFGDRMDEREVSLLVLVLAVAVYGPLRTWLGAGVRRLMFGRRGDRYGVVSSFAAHLESTRRVEEQLPALARAVAETFKVPFVRVEVVTPSGGTVAATHGEPGEDVQQVDIGYRDERIGRLVVPQRGLRSMLSRRDQALLVDLVRQAAIAIRASLLADELQDSRERLVLGREDDRRRIRRDLHDGLGPMLGGVALRLDAAGNAVEADPESARRLIRLARTEVREALDDVRRLVHDLRPPALDDLGLRAALEQQAERVSTEVAVTVDADGTGDLPAAVEVAAYRIVSEALANVVKHARATTASVRLHDTGGVLEVEVRDDGTGIAEDVSAGVGLLSLRERAEELGGRCEVSCPDGGGTLVRAWLPKGVGATDEEERDG